MRFLFRADASVSIGSGHIMRCLTLAQELRNSGHECIFVSRKLEGELAAFVRDKGFKAWWLPEQETSNWCEKDDAAGFLEIVRCEGKIDWVVVDHYALSSVWEHTTASSGEQRVMVIDDLANRKHSCDVILDQNIYSAADTRYQGLIPTKTLQLIGPHYSMLRPEFVEARDNQSREISIGPLNWFVFFGGSDEFNQTSKVLAAMKQLNLSEGTEISVVVGSSNPHKDQVEALCEEVDGAHFYCQIDFIAELMAKADLAIGGGGSATLERMCLGLPSVVVTLADNQRVQNEYLASLGMVKLVGDVDRVRVSDYEQSLDAVTKDVNWRESVQIKSKQLVDGCGVARVANVLTGESNGI